MSPVMISAAVLLIMCIAGMMVYFLRTGDSQRKKRLMQVVQGGQAQGGKKAQSPDQRRAELAKKLKESHDEDKPDGKGETMAQKLTMAGLNLSVKQFWIYAVVLSAVVAVGVHVLYGNVLVSALAGITALFGGSKFILNFMINHRQKKFMDDLADALESMQRLLKAGMPVSECIKMVAREFSGPVGEEMGRIFDQQKIGVPLPEATLEAAKRMPIAEMQMLATAIAIQTQTGSSLSEVLENLSAVIRARFRLKRKVKALSSEAKASAAIIGSLPMLVGVGMYFLNNAYVMLLWTDGKHLIIGAGVWMLIGILVMRQMINFKV